jgi:asparagine synthase (glutamine-hydrolysing)
LGLTQSEIEVTPDSQLAMLAYQKWKEKCVYHLEGDWAFVLYDAYKESVFIAKDKSGVSSLFYIVISNQLYFSSDSKSILSLNGNQFSINCSNFEKMLKIGFNLSDETTLINDLYFLKNGKIIEFNYKLIQVPQIYWEIPFTDNLNYRLLEDYVADFNFYYSEAIKSAVRSGSISKNDIGIFLSSGLDSTSVCFFASKELEHKSKKISTFTSFPSHNFEGIPETSIICNEMPIVKKYLSSLTNINASFHEFSNYDQSLIFKRISIQEAFNPIVTKNSFWINGIMDYSKNAGIKNILTGQIGNYTVSWSGGYHYSDLLFRLKIKPLIDDIQYELKLKRGVFFNTLKTILFQPVVIQLSSLYRSFIFEKKFKSNSLFDYNPSVYSKKSRSRFYFIPFLISNILPQKKMRKILQQNSILFCGISWAINSTNSAVQVVDPTSDSRLITFLNAIPHRFYFMKGIRKYLFKTLMKGRIPEYILDNKKRKIQSYDFPLRIKNDSIFDELIYTKSSGVGKVYSFNAKKTNELLSNIHSKPMSYLESGDVNMFLRALSLKIFSNSIK